MTQQQTDPIQAGISYLHHQGSKDFAAIDALLERTARDWEECLASMSETQACFRPGGEWCAKEVIAHVLLTDRSVNQDVARMAGVEPPGAETQQVRAMGQVPEDVAALPLEELRSRVAQLFEETRALGGRLQASNKLEAGFPHPLFGPLNLKEWLAFHRIHGMDHIQQIEKIKAEAAYPTT